MAIDVTMPKLSDTMEEGKILRWLKHVGDPVKIGDVIAEVETDKANMELEAYDEGVLSELKVGEGDSAPVGAVIAVLGAPGEKPAAAETAASAPAAGGAAKPAGRPAPAGERPAQTEARPAPEEAEAPGSAPVDKQAASSGRGPTPRPRPAETRPEPVREARRPATVQRPEPPPAEPERVRASPLARRIAEERGVDLTGVTGTGPGGRIVERDVEATAAGRGAEPARPAVTMRAEPGPASGPPRPEAPKPGTRVELTRIRRTTAKRMGEAKREIPHFYASAEIVMDEAIRLKEGLAALGPEYEGLTYTHVVLRAVGLALRRVPELNASYDGDAMVLHADVNVGMATAVDDGLVVPVVHHCDREPLAAIVRQARGLVERARSGRFAGDDLSGGTFTISNLGMFPVSEFAAVINPPQAGILAVSAIRDVGVVHEGHVVAGRMMTVTLSCDHRIIDGVLAARFLRELKALLERPLALIA